MTLHLTDISSGKDTSAKVASVAPSSPYRAGLKRVFETLLVLAALPIVLPAVVILALLVASDGHSPFYSQKRVGRGGRVFRMWKLRTMVPDADAMLAAYLARTPAARLEWDATQKLKHDPRITVVGRALRKTSLDELPQLFSVLTGDMALVGPRPMMVEQQELYTGQSYYRLRPGVTGLWQISDRNACEFRDRVRFDDAYDSTLSFATDVSIILRTVAVVVRGTGY